MLSFFISLCLQDPAEVGPGDVVSDGHLPASCALVESHELETASNDDLWQRLRSIDADSAMHIHPNDRRKVKRCQTVIVFRHWI